MTVSQFRVWSRVVACLAVMTWRVEEVPFSWLFGGPGKRDWQKQSRVGGWCGGGVVEGWEHFVVNWTEQGKVAVHIFLEKIWKRSVYEFMFCRVPFSLLPLNELVLHVTERKKWTVHANYLSCCFTPPAILGGIVSLLFADEDIEVQCVTSFVQAHCS